MIGILAALLISCEKEQNVVEEGKIVLFSMEEYQINYDGGEVFWKSDNPMIASVNQSGLVIALTVGKTDILAGSRVYEVEVIPKYDDFIEPYHDWNAPREYLEKYMEEKCGDGTIYAEESIYYDDTHLATYTYVFDERDNVKLFQIDTSLVFAEIFTYWLTERYFLMGEKENVYYLVTSDMDMAVMYGVNSSLGLTAIMFPFTDDTRVVNNMREELINLLH